MTVPTSAASKAANDNLPVVRLTPLGDPKPLARTLLRVLVRRALISEGVIANVEHCDDQHRAG